MPMLRNYGLFWRTRNVYWGKVGAGGFAGRLDGYTAGNADQIIDFAQQVGVYVLYSDYKIVYVGQTGTGTNRLLSRLRQHRRDQLADRWDQFSWFGMRAVLGTGELGNFNQNINDVMETALNHFEAILIAACEPPLNRQGGAFGDDVVQYLQHRDERELGPAPDRMLLDIWRVRGTRK